MVLVVSNCESLRKRRPCPHRGSAPDPRQGPLNSCSWTPRDYTRSRGGATLQQFRVYPLIPLERYTKKGLVFYSYDLLDQLCACTQQGPLYCLSITPRLDGAYFSEFSPKISLGLLELSLAMPFKLHKKCSF